MSQVTSAAFDQLLTAFQTIKWRLSPIYEAVSVPKDNLSDSQRATLDDIVAKGYLEASEYSDDFTFSPPDAFQPEHQALWEAVFLDAQERLNTSFRPLADLPWKQTRMSSNEYFVWASELTPEQIDALKQMPDATRRERNGSLLIGLRENDTLYVLSDDRSNRLHALVHEKIAAQIEHDTKVMVQLPWQFDTEGNLVLPVETMAALPERKTLQQLVSGNSNGEQSVAITPGKADAADVFSRREIVQAQGLYVLILPNTVGKLYEQPDGETDKARHAFYDAVHDAVLERNAPLLNLPFRFDAEKWKFILAETDLTPTQQGIAGDALARQGQAWELSDLAAYGWRAFGPRQQVRAFRDKLEATVPDIEINDLAELPWKYTSEGLSVSEKLFRKSQFAKINCTFFSPRVKFETDYHKNIIINPDKLDELPYYAIVKRRLEERFAQFVSKHADEIRALPWNFHICDDLAKHPYPGPQLYRKELSPEQDALVQQLFEMNQLSCHLEKRFDRPTSRLADLLVLRFEQWKLKTIQTLSALPWQYSAGGGYLHILKERLDDPTKETLQRAGLHSDQWGQYRLPQEYGSEESAMALDLQCAIARKIRDHSPAIKLDPGVLSLSGWQYDRERSIVLVANQKDIPPGLQSIPGSYYYESMHPFQDRNRVGYLCLQNPSDDARKVVPGILGEVYYKAFQPMAEQNLTRLIGEVAEFPWRQNSQGTYETSLRDLTKEQQEKIRQLPGDFFDYGAQRKKHDSYSENRFFVLYASAPDQRLLEALRKSPERPAMSVPKAARTDLVP